MKRYLKELLLFSVLLLIITNTISYYRSKELNPSILNIADIALIDNQTIEQQKPIIIYYWGSWCSICKIESPNIELLSKYFNVLSIATKSGNEYEVKEYLKTNNLSFKTHNDENATLSKTAGISVYPTIIIYDKNGKLYSSDIGYTSTFMLAIKYLLASI